jgi:hypothetical protein
MIAELFYLFQSGNRMEHHQDISKIEYTNDFNSRKNEYSLDTQIISVCSIDNEKKCECGLIREPKSELDFRSDIDSFYFEVNKRDTISAFNDHSSDHLPNRYEEINMDDHWLIEDQRLTAEGNQRGFKKFKLRAFYFTFPFTFDFPFKDALLLLFR